MGNLAAIVRMVADYRRCPPPCRRLAQAQCPALRHYLIAGKLLRYAMIYWGMNAVAG